MQEEDGSPLFFQRRLARLQSLLEASRRIHGTIDLQEILQQTLRILTLELEVEGVFLTGAEGFPIPWLRFGRTPERPTDTLADLREGRFPGAPLLRKDGREMAFVGVVMEPGRYLDPEEENFLEGLILQAALAAENALYHQERLTMERLQRDLNTARAIQRSLLPLQMPEIAGYDLAARSEPCYEVGGDYLDIVPAQGGRHILVVADVAGKGLSSALVGSAFRASLRAMARAGIPLGDAATSMNLLHYEEGEETRRKYVTAFLAQLDPAQNRLDVVNAGHTSALLVGPDETVRQVKSTGMPLGLMPSNTFRSEALEIIPGQTLLMYSDGLSEAMRGEEEFGIERLEAAALALRRRPAAEFLEALWDEVDAFSDGTYLCDDKTALILRRES